MNPIWAAAGAVLGLLAGAALRGTVFKLSVASGDPERTRLPALQRAHPASAGPPVRAVRK